MGRSLVVGEWLKSTTRIQRAKDHLVGQTPRFRCEDSIEKDFSNIRGVEPRKYWL